MGERMALQTWTMRIQSKQTLVFIYFFNVVAKASYQK